MSQEKENESEIYRAWLYKDGKAEIFEGKEVEKKIKEGWFDSQDKASAAASKPDKTAPTSGTVPGKSGESGTTPDKSAAASGAVTKKN